MHFWSDVCDVALQDHCAISIFGGRGSWTGREELQLLEAVELYGFGNWEFVSEYVQTRTPEGELSSLLPALEI